MFLFFSKTSVLKKKKKKKKSEQFVLLGTFVILDQFFGVTWSY